MVPRSRVWDAEGDSQVFKVFFPDRVQQRRPSCRSLTFPVEVFKVLALDRFHQRLRLFTLQLVRTMTRMCLVKGFFALFPVLKKVRRLLRTRGRNCLRTPAHGRRRLSWRTPSSGCGSGRTTLARRTSGTDVLTVLSGSRRLASLSCGTAKRMRREESGTGTRTRVCPRSTSLLFLLGEERDRQPRAVYKYWVAAYLPVTMQRHVPAVLRVSWPIWTRRTVAVVCTRLVLLVTLHLEPCSLPCLAGPVCLAFWPVRTCSTVAVACAKLVFLVFMHLALCCLRCTGKLDFGGRGILLRPLVSGSHLFELFA